MSLTDYAKGGATSGAVPAVAVVPAGFANNSMPVSVEIPSTMEQVSSHFASCCEQCAIDTFCMLHITSCRLPELVCPLPQGHANEFAHSMCAFVGKSDW